jgi:hypothetical protein
LVYGKKNKIDGSEYFQELSKKGIKSGEDDLLGSYERDNAEASH